MSRITFENYGKAARNNPDLTLVSGRYEIQKLAERLIITDVASKLSLSSEDKLLEIGCGPGNLLIPLSFLVSMVMGIDHPDVCARLEERFSDQNLKTLGINFLDYEGPAEAFDKILIYSVINTLTDENEAFLFIDKAVRLLAPGGILMIGDIANIDRKNRFLQSSSGKKFQENWEKEMAETAKKSAGVETHELNLDKEVFQPNDNFVVKVLLRYREVGMHTYLLQQPGELPFGMTREDIIISRT